MNTKLAQKWIDDLRNMPEELHTTGAYLKPKLAGYQYCALGVFYYKDLVDQKVPNPIGQETPSLVCSLDLVDGSITSDVIIWNDIDKLSFRQIADNIRSQLNREYNANLV